MAIIKIAAVFWYRLSGSWGKLISALHLGKSHKNAFQSSNGISFGLTWSAVAK